MNITICYYYENSFEFSICSSTTTTTTSGWLETSGGGGGGGSGGKRLHPQLPILLTDWSAVSAVRALLVQRPLTEVREDKGSCYYTKARLQGRS